MKRVIFFLSCAILAVCNALATQNYTFNFSESDYQIVTDAQGITTIYATDNSFYEESSDPCLPISLKSIAICPDEIIANFSTKATTARLIKNNVTLSSNPIVMCPSEDIAASDYNVRYAAGRYPQKNSWFLSSTNLEGLALANFAITPFVYDSKTKQLYFIDKFIISFDTTESSNTPMRMRNINNATQIANSIVSNPSEIEDITSNLQLPSEYYNRRIDYLIITNEELKDTFTKLVNWKRTKGVFADIVTTEEIETQYQGEDLTEKVKRCIYDTYINNGLQYALLGGDNFMIPSRKCYAKSGSWADYTIPSDKYFGCFNGDFLWNANKNDVYGQLDDNIDFSESVHIGRVSVRKIAEANAYIEKLINYETARDAKRLKKSILTGGVKKWNNFNLYGGRSDTDLQGDLLFNDYIQPYWNGERTRFYDTGTDLPGDANYNITPTNLQTQLLSDRLFMSFGTHGAADAWAMEGSPNFTSSIAKEINGSTIPIITTEACSTNKFDSAIDPCLSEAFIRSKSNSVVAYLGSSRYGWGVSSPTVLGPSLDYEAQFYKYLLSNDIPNKNIGNILEAAKLAMQYRTNLNNSYRWLQYSLNLMGDPEMPVFTETPLTFKNINIDFSRESNTLNVSLDTKDCRICVISYRDNGKTFQEVRENTSNAVFYNLPTFMAICISKQNYEPYLYVIDNGVTGVIESKAHYTINGIRYYSIITHADGNEYEQEAFPEIEVCNVNRATQSLDLSISEMSDVYSVEVRNIMGGADVYEVRNESKVSIDMTGKQKGVYAVSLIKNGIVVDSKKVFY